MAIAKKTENTQIAIAKKAENTPILLNFNTDPFLTSKLILEGSSAFLFLQ